MSTENVTNCKYCQSENVIKYGKYKAVQRYFCKDCKRKFAGIDTIPKMQYPTSQVSDAINMYYEGMSLKEIRRNFIQQHNDYISDVSALNWVNRFSKLAIMEANKYKPDVGSVWTADETVIDIDGKNIWFWDIIDTKTRFLIASHMSYTRTSKDAEQLMKQAYERTGKIPRVIYTDKLRAYLEGIERTFGGDTKHKQGSPHLILRIIPMSLNCEEYYTPDWWLNEDYYIQMLVEKIDLKTLFEPICEQYHIPIATSKGWSSMLQRAEYAKRFFDAENAGLKCVLLYCGDHDPDGLRISEFIRKNLDDLRDIVWGDGTPGYDPSDLIIDRFGLNFEFIIDNNLTWIDNLITSSGNNLASPNHRNYNMPYVQNYLAEVGERKCEANALVINPTTSRDLVRTSITQYIGDTALERFEQRRQEIRDTFSDSRKQIGFVSKVNEIIRLVE